MNSITRFKALVQLALVDNSFDDPERSFILNLGKANQIPETKIKSIFHDQLKKKEFDEIHFIGLSLDQKIEYLVNIIELMKVDGKIYLSEINYCKNLAEKLGFKRSVIDRVSSMIHSNSKVNTDWNLLKSQIESETN